MTPSQVRTLLIGAAGQLGRALAASFADRALVTASHQQTRPSDVRIDLSEATATHAVLCEVRPDVILVAGAMCNVDLCEVEPAICERTNTRGPALVADYARTHGARVVFFSTDHVFDGTRPSYVETDTVNPLNVYARSKALAEDRLRALVPDHHLIIRTGWLYGRDWERRNFVLRLVDRVRAGERVAVPRDQWGSPTYTDDLAAATRHLVERGESGTFHATGPDLFNRFALAERICAHAGLTPCDVVGQPTSELKQQARRSLKVLLDCRKLQRVGAPPFRGVADGLRSLTACGELRERP